LLKLEGGYYRDLWEKQSKSNAQQEKELADKAAFLEEQQAAIDERKGKRASMFK